MNSLKQPRVVIGSVLIVLGLVFVSMNLGFIESVPFSRFWPVVVILIGIGKLVQSDNARERWGGAWLILLGLWLQVSVLKLFGLSFHNSWPILLIIWGVYIAGGAMTRQSSTILAKENTNGE